MSAAVIVNVGEVLLGDADPYAGQYLAAYDPNGRDGRGTVTWTPDPARAMVFASLADAWECWQQTSRTLPRRSDGKPNRPLTAYTVAINPAPAGSAGAR